MSDAAGVVADLVAGRDPGSTLTEPEAQRITTALGIGVPRTGEPLPGERVVVKVVGPAHKTDIGGVRVVANDPRAIATAEQALLRLPGATGTLIAEFVEHDLEIIAGVRWTDGFGPVVSIGSGGIAAEADADPAIVSAETRHRLLATLETAPGTRRLTHPLRGTTPVVSAAVLADLAARLLDLGAATMPHHLAAFEMNPVTVVAGRPIALDALAVVGSGVAAVARPVRDLSPLLAARSIAIVGVSDRMNPGRVILRNVLDAGFLADRITVVKSGVDQVEGCRTVPDLAALPPVDLLVLAVPAAGIPAIMETVAAGGLAGAVVLIPGGLGERPGSEGAATAIRITLTAAGDRAPIVLGPNTMGIRSPGYDTTFIPPERMTPGKVREVPLAVVAQSGAFTLARLDRLPGIRPRHVVTVGNQLDLTAGEVVEAVVADPEVSLVALYLEGVAPGDGVRVLRAATQLRRRGGTMLWYRGGRTAAGVEAAATHTAAIATDDRVARTLGSSAGIVEAESLDAFDDLLAIAVAWEGRPPRGRRLAVISNAGFECVAAADALGDLTMATLAPATIDRLRGILDTAGLADIAGTTNPVDLTPLADAAVYAAVATAILDDPGVDAAVIGCIPYSPAIDPDALAEALIPVADHPTPWAAVIDAGPRYHPLAQALRQAGIPVLPAMDRAVGGIAIRNSRFAIR